MPDSLREQTDDTVQAAFSAEYICRREFMNERIFNIMGRAGAASIAMGILVALVGVVVGILNVACGVLLLKNRKDVIF